VSEDAPAPGRVLLGATPLGNPGDASARLIDALRTAPVIAAEDTRRLRRLTQDLGVQPVGRIVSFFEGNERERTPGLIEALRAGDDVLVVTDAGMPSVSDPGYRLVAEAIAQNLPVTILPGPSAVLSALAVSGLPVDRFCFEGFLPRKAGDRRKALAALATEPRTMIFFEAPHRLGESLADLSAAFGPQRAAAVCRELTKTYEQVRRGELSELAKWATGDVRGEITIVVAGAPPAGPIEDPVRLAEMVSATEAQGVARKSAMAIVAAQAGVAKRVVYDAVIAAKHAH
jgi:16S rRNA (cytidine1402-2'-O)-methyltransferase